MCHTPTYASSSVVLVYMCPHMSRELSGGGWHVQLERTALDAAASGGRCAGANGGGAMLAKELGVCISTVAVRHSCRDACGVIVENLSAPPWKIVYSGDTRPCQALEAAGAGLASVVTGFSSASSVHVVVCTYTMAGEGSVTLTKL